MLFKKNKTKCGVFSKDSSSIEMSRIINITKTGIRLYKTLTLPLIRRSLPILMSQNVVGVQAMARPIGLAFALRFAYDRWSVLYNELV